MKQLLIEEEKIFDVIRPTKPQSLLPEPLTGKSTPTHKTKSPSFRFQATSVFLTYPRSNLTSDVLRDELMKRIGIDEYLIAEENHADDDGIHFHVYLRLKDKLRTTDQRLFDILNEHPNIQSVRNRKKTLNYCMKDGKFVTNLDKDSLLSLKDKEKKKADDNVFIMTSDPIMLVKTGKISVFNLKRVIEAQTLFKSMQPDLREQLPSPLENPWGLKFIFDSDYKKRHAWVYSSKPNYGKTTFAKSLNEKYFCYMWNYEEKFQNPGEETELIIMDEFKKEQRVTLVCLNTLADNTFCFPRKGILPLRLQTDYNVLVLSNYPPQDIFGGIDLATFDARFVVYNLEKFHSGF